MDKASKSLELIRDYSSHKDQELRRQLASILPLDTDQKVSFNTQCVKTLRLTLQNSQTHAQDNTHTLRSLLKTLFFAQQSSIVNLSVILGFIDDIFECLPFGCLRDVFETVENQMDRIDVIEAVDQDILLRIINGMLKRIPRSQDIEFRGRLQILLSKILRLCHVSGMVKHDVSRVTTEDLVTETADQPFVNPNKIITHKFYLRFWGLQKYFADPANTLFSGVKDDHMDVLDQDVQQDNKGKKMNNTKLKSISSVILDVLRIFSNNPVTQNCQEEFHPPKYLTGENLLGTQINDPYFRKLFAIQGLLFCFNLLNTATKNPFLIGEEEKKTLLEIQKAFSDYLGPDKIKQYIEGQKNWIDLKQNFKDRKKTLIKEPNIQVQDSLKYYYSQSSDPDSVAPKNIYGLVTNTQSHAFLGRQQKVFSGVFQKMMLQGSKMKEYLQKQAQTPKPLQTDLAMPSFYYYYQESLRALNDFDQEGNFQSVFDRKQAYSLYEWKALKALSRESIKDLQLDRKDTVNGKYKEYRLLHIVKKREDQFGEMATKRQRIQ